MLEGSTVETAAEAPEAFFTFWFRTADVLAVKLASPL